MASPIPPSEAVANAARDCAQALLVRLPALAREWAEGFVEAEPRMAAGSTGFASAVLGTEMQSGAILSVLAFGLPLSAVDLSPVAVQLMRQTINQGADLADLLRLYNFGHQMGWRMWSEQVSARVSDLALRSELLAWSGTCLAAIWAHMREQITELYRAEYGAASSARTSGDSLAVTLDAVLGTGLIDLTSAGSTLGCDLSAHHVGLVLAPLVDADVRPAFVALGALGAAGQVSCPERDGMWSVWLSWPAAPGEDTCERIGAIALDGIVAGMGEPGAGRAGFRRSHSQALQVVRTALLATAPTAAVFRHRDLRMAATLCADPIRARLLADELLGALGDDTEHCARLRETLFCYLSHACNKTSTAQALHVHHKTVTYRLDQAQALLGCTVAANPLEIGAALLIKRTLDG